MMLKHHGAELADGYGISHCLPGLPVTRGREPGGLTLRSGRQAMEGATSGRAVREKECLFPILICKMNQFCQFHYLYLSYC